MKLPKGKYELWATRTYATMMSQGFLEYTMEHGCRAIIQFPIGEDKGDYIVHSQSFDYALKKIGEKFIKNHKKLFGQYEKSKKNLFISCEKLSRQAGKISDKKLALLFKDYWKNYRLFQPYLMFPHYCERVFEGQMKKRFPKDFSLITGLSKPLEHMKMERDLLRLPIQDVVKKYNYLSLSGMIGEPFDEKFFTDYKNKISENEVDKKFEEIRSNKEKFKKFLKNMT